MAKHTEESFEATIVDQMKANGWRESNHQDYDRSCMMPEEVYEFILATQPKEWEKLHAVQGSDAKKVCFSESTARFLGVERLQFYARVLNTLMPFRSAISLHQVG